MSISINIIRTENLHVYQVAHGVVKCMNIADGQMCQKPASNLVTDLSSLSADGNSHTSKKYLCKDCTEVFLKEDKYT